MPSRPLVRSLQALVVVGLVGCGSGGGGGSPAAPAAAPNPALVAISPAGAPANDSASECALSSDGRWSAFASMASNLVPGDDAVSVDVFVRDLDGTAITQVNRSEAGVRVTGMVYVGGISADGRYVAISGDLETGSAPSTSFRKDRQTGTLLPVAVPIIGSLSDKQSTVGAMSEDGRVIAVRSSSAEFSAFDGNSADDVYVAVISADGTSSTTELVSRRRDPVGGDFVSNDAGNGYSGGDRIALSGDGRYVVYASYATDLVPGDVSARQEVFRYDRTAGKTTRVAVATSPNGEGNGSSSMPSISRDGQCVAFQSTSTDLIVGESLPAPTGDTPPSHVYVRDVATGTTRRLSSVAGAPAAGWSFAPTISADGRWIAFASTASDLPNATSGFTGLYLYDWNLGTLRRIDLGAAGYGNHNAMFPRLSADGSRVVFASSATNFAPGTVPGDDLFSLTLAPSGAG